MDFSACSQDGGINLYFVLPVDKTQEMSSLGLNCAYQACQEHELEPTWLQSVDCITMNPTKQDVFVCDPFEGDAYDHLLSGRYKCVRVLGPRCLLSCLRTKRPVPELPSPLHNMAMHELVVTSTGFDKDDKIEIQKMVEKMCGIYSNNFHDGITHLVAKAVGSKKYLVALEKEVPVMTKGWVTEVWNVSNSEPIKEVSATEEMYEKFTCPILLGLTICLSQVSRKDKDELKKLIEENGGIYAGNLEMSVTSVVILPLPEGEKYKHATKWRIPCITQDWLLDSLEAGHAVSMDNYKVEKRPKASTPTHETSVRVPDMSQCSTILSDTIMCRKEIQINETVETEFGFVFRKPESPEDAIGVRELIDLDLEVAYRAGFFLDGCRVYVSGFSISLQEKLRKLINSGGGIRSPVLNESLSHIVIGSAPEFSLSILDTWTNRPYVVNANWLLESIRLKRPADESVFDYGRNKTSYVKENLPEESVIKVSESETFMDEDILRQYLKTDNLEDTVNMCEVQSSQQVDGGGIFGKKIVLITGFNDEEHNLLCSEISTSGGRIVDDSYKGKVDYSVVPLSAGGNLQMESAHFVTHLYIEDCLEQEAIVPIEYFHLPFGWDQENLPLLDCVIATSIYKGKERGFLIHIINLLGGNFQEMFAKKDAPSRGVKCSTHLVCPEPDGDKYKAACKWDIPVVTKDWLIECIRCSFRPSDHLFQVGASPSHRIDAYDVMLQAFMTFKMEENISQDVTADSVCIAATPAVSKAVKNFKEKQLVTEITTPDLDTMRKLYPTPGRVIGNDTLDTMSTPETPYGRTWHTNPTSRVRKGFKRVIESLTDDKPAKRVAKKVGTPEGVYVKKFFDNVETFLSQRSVPATVTKTAQRDSPVANENCSSVKNGRDSPGENDEFRGPLTGVVVYASQKLNDVQAELYAAVVELGGKQLWTYNEEVTHFVHSGRMNDTNKEFRLARDQNKFVVAPDWVWMCRAESKRVDESLFPHTHNPKMSLSIMSSKATPMKIVRQQRRITTIKPLEDTIPGDDDDNKANALSRQLEKIGEFANAAGSSRIQKRSSTITPKGSVISPSKKIPVQKSDVRQDTESQAVAITWDDPQEREARQKLKISCSKDTQEILANMQMPETTNVVLNSVQNDPDDCGPFEENTELDDDSDTQIDMDDVTETVPKRSSCANPVVIMSGMQGDELGMYEDLLISLGGKMAANQSHLDPEVTHIVTMMPSRSEKHLAAIAAGKWVLYKSFLDYSMDAGYFVCEEPHEWGNTESDLLPEVESDSTEAKLSAAAHRWRISRGKSGKGAFSGMTAMLYTTNERSVSFSRMIVAGGGRLVNIRKPKAEDLCEVTHCLVELNRRPDIDLALFASLSIPCLSPIYLHLYLISEIDPVDDCIPAYKAILEQMS